MKTINIQQLNTDFGITDQLIFIEGKGGLPLLQVSNPKATALISIYAGQVLSFHPVKEQEDLLFLSKKAYYQQEKAIRGGIPICWPWFGADPENPKNPSHGFARNTNWSVASVSVLENGDTKIELELFDTERTKKLWPYIFYLSLEITIGDDLTLQLTTHNTGNQTFSITDALHTYFKVGDATQLQIFGLEQTEYQDKTDNYSKACQIGTVRLNKETDYIYTDMNHDLIIDDPSLDRKIRIRCSGNNNIVIWNPWEKGSADIADLASDNYKHFVCVEVADTDSIAITPGSHYKLVTRYSILGSLTK